MTPSKHAPIQALIIDDHELFRLGLRDLMNKLEDFHIAAEANSLQEALAFVAKKSVDLLLLDSSLVGSDMVALLRRLKQKQIAPDIIIISASLDTDMLLDAVMAGAVGYITKDMSVPDFIQALQGYRNGEFAMSSSIMAKAMQLLLQQCKELKTVLNARLQANFATHEKASCASAENRAPASLHMSTASRGTLTPREEKVMQLMRLGYSNKEIAAQLGISRYTVSKHVQNILRKLNAANRTQAVSYAYPV